MPRSPENSAVNVGGWHVIPSHDGKYLYITREGSPGHIDIKAEDEGFVVDIWTDNDPPAVASTACATYAELERE